LKLYRHVLRSITSVSSSVSPLRIPSLHPSLEDGEIRQTCQSPDYGTLYVAAFARQTTCPANTVYVQLCLESAQYGRMCQAWPLPYGDGQEFVAQYDHMPAGEYTLYVRYYGVGCVNGEIIL
jgi:hypothetical protein